MVKQLRMVLAATLLIGCAAASERLYGQQIGVGVGLAATGESARMAGGEVEDFLRRGDNELAYSDISGDIGIYGKLAGRYGLGGGLRLAGDAAYIYIQNEKVRLTTLDVAEDSSVSATFEVGTSFIPVSLGLEYALPTPVVHPYVGVYPTYTFVNRTFTFIEGDEISEIQNRSAGENEFGMGVEAGVEFSLLALTVGVSARYTSANLFTADDNENVLGTFMLGGSLWFGSTGGDD